MTMRSEAGAVQFTLDGEAVAALGGETILQAGPPPRPRDPAPLLQGRSETRRQLPRLCGGDRRRAGPGPLLLPQAERRHGRRQHRRAPAPRQKMVLELLQSDMAETAYTRDSELDAWSARLGLGRPRFPAREQPPGDVSHPAIAVNLDACIQCTRCLRACREVQVNNVIGFARRGAEAEIVFDLGDPLGESTCVACGECVQACPTGALMPAGGLGLEAPERRVDSVCPYCGVGCQLSYHVGGDRILYVTGRDGPANSGRLCVKGRYGFDYVHHAQRLTVPLIRRPDAPKQALLGLDPADPFRGFREASWEEALDLAAAGLREIRDHQGPPPWRASAPPRAPTRRPTCSRSWCVPGSGPTTWTTAPASATPPRWPRCWR